MHQFNTSFAEAMLQSIHRTGTKLAFSLIAIPVGVAWQAEASACSVAQPPAGLMGYPSDSQTGVPTDAVPFYDIMTARLEEPAHADAEFTLTSVTGESIPLSLTRSHVQKFSLFPEHPLAPNTTYVLRYFTTEEVDQVMFTTGSGPVAAPPSPPPAFLEHYQTEEPSSSCDPPANGTCVALPAGVFVEETMIDSFGQEGRPHLHATSHMTANLSGIAQGTNFECIKLRTRAANATYSDPIVLCGDDAATVSVDRGREISCSPEGIVLGAKVPDAPNPDGGGNHKWLDVLRHFGCSFTQPVTSGAGAASAGSLLALAGLFARRRRAAKR